MKKERLVNIRFLFCVFIGLIFGIIFSYLFLVEKINLFAFVLSIVLMILISISCWVYGYYTKKKNQSFKSRKNVSFLIQCSGIGFISAFIVGLLIIIYPMQDILHIKQYNSNVVLNGSVCDYVDKQETYTKFVIDDCTLISNNESEDINFKVIVYTSNFIDVNLGDNVVLSGVLDKFDYEKDYEMSQLCQNIGYSIYASNSNIIVNDGDPTFKDKTHTKVRELLDKNLNKDNSDICFAVLFGQKQGLSDDLTEMFSYSGISHILAVSGLHIGVLVSCIWFFLNKSKLNKYVKLVILTIILLVYSYLCAFSPSVCRASLMAITLALCKSLKWEYDSLSSLSLSGIVILLISPLSLFSISFQLSYMCVFAIITFAPTLNKLFRKIKIPKALATTLAISIAVNIVILPICMNTFAQVSLLGILTNIFVLPIFSFVYVLLFMVILLSLIINSLGVLLFIPELFLHLIKAIAIYINQVPFGAFKVFKVGYIIVFVIALLCLTIHYLMTKVWWKSVWVGLLSIIVVITCILYSIPTKYSDDSLIICEQYNSNVVLYVEDDDVYLIGSEIKNNSLKLLMKEAGLKKIDYIIAYDFKLNQAKNLEEIVDSFGVNKIIVPSEFKFEEISSRFDCFEYFDFDYSAGDMNINTIRYGKEIIAISITIPVGKFLVPVMNNNNTENNYLISKHFDVDYVIIYADKTWESVLASVIMINITNIDMQVYN